MSYVEKGDMVATLKVTPVADAAPLAEVLTGFVERNDVVLDFGASSLRDFEDVM